MYQGTFNATKVHQFLLDITLYKLSFLLLPNMAHVELLPKKEKEHSNLKLMFCC